MLNRDIDKKQEAFMAENEAFFQEMKNNLTPQEKQEIRMELTTTFMRCAFLCQMLDESLEDFMDQLTPEKMQAAMEWQLLKNPPSDCTCEDCKSGCPCCDEDECEDEGEDE